MAEITSKAGNKAREDNARLANELKGTRYEDMVKENPYLKQEYTNGLWDKFGDWLGFRTKQDQWREQMEMASNEYTAQITSLKSEDEYNSPAAKAAREQEAGLNPDLIGTGDAENAAAMTEPETRPEIPGGENAELNQFAGVISSVISMTMGLAKDIEAFKQIKNEVDAGEIQNADKYVKLAQEYVLNWMPVEYYQEENEGLKYDAFTKGLIIAQQGADEYAKTNFKSKSARKRFLKALNYTAGGARSAERAYSTLNNYVKNRTEYAKGKSSMYWNESDAEMIELFKTITQPVEQLYKDVTEYKSRYQKELNENDAPEVEAGAEIAENRAQEQEAETRKTNADISNRINATWDSILKGLDEQIEKKGTWWAYLAKYAILAIRLSNISVSGGSKPSKEGGSFGSFNIGF